MKFGHDIVKGKEVFQFVCDTPSEEEAFEDLKSYITNENASIKIRINEHNGKVELRIITSMEDPDFEEDGDE